MPEEEEEEPEELPQMPEESEDWGTRVTQRTPVSPMLYAAMHCFGLSIICGSGFGLAFETEQQKTEDKQWPPSAVSVNMYFGLPMSAWLVGVPFTVTGRWLALSGATGLVRQDGDSGRV